MSSGGASEQGGYQTLKMALAAHREVTRTCLYIKFSEARSTMCKNIKCIRIHTHTYTPRNKRQGKVTLLPAYH